MRRYTVRILCRSSYYAPVRVLFQIAFIRRIVLLCVWCVSVLRLHVGVFLVFHSLPNDFNKLDAFSGGSILVVGLVLCWFHFEEQKQSCFKSTDQFLEVNFPILIRSDMIENSKIDCLFEFFKLFQCVCGSVMYTSSKSLSSHESVSNWKWISCEMDWEFNRTLTARYESKAAVESWKSWRFYQLNASNIIDIKRCRIFWYTWYLCSCGHIHTHTSHSSQCVCVFVHSPVPVH